jgi:hypothetical protein
MKLWLRQVPPGITSSEDGFLAVAGRQSDLPLREVFLHFRDLVSADMAWADSRKRRNRRRASMLRIVALGLTAASTVVLGIEAIPNRQWWALPMVALVTVLGGLEAFLSWRSLWVLMEETQYRLNRLRDRMDFHLVSTPSGDLTLDQLTEFFDEHQAIWADTSRQWLGFRTLVREPLAGQERRG